MKNIITLTFLLSITLVSFNSCTCCKAKTVEVKEGYSRLVVTFISKASGIDYEVRDKFTAYLKTNYPDVKYDYKNWGREGEKDYCFQLETMTAKEQKKFISEIEKEFGVNPLINVVENGKCH